MMKVTCRCGADLQIDAERYPDAATCHVCNRLYSVLDDGTIIDTHQEKAAQVRSDALAIQEGAIIPAAPTPDNATSIAAGLPDDRIHPDLQRELAHRRQSLVSVVGITILPSRTLSYAVAMLILVGSGFFLEMALWTHSSYWYWFGAISAVLSFCSLAFICHKANQFEKAETEWLCKRSRIFEVTGMPYPEEKEPSAKRPAWHKVLLGVSLLAALALAADIFSQNGIYWVGYRDLEITFLVMDAETNEPIAGAEIDIPESRSDFCHDCNNAFKLVTDAQGTSKRMCKDCMCFGYSGGKPFFRRLETFGTHTPDWMLHVTAPGFQRSDRRFLHEREFRQTIQRGEGFATMKVPIKLQRLPVGK